MRFSVLASGSRANCTYFEAGATRILIDCGLSARETERRLRSIGVEPSTIQAIIVTHEHRDHINGIPVFSKRYRVPVFANRATAQFVPDAFALEEFSTGTQFHLLGIDVSPFRIEHDALDPVGFVLEYAGLRYGQATDLGKVTPLVRHSVSNCHALVLESNYDPELLHACDYPWVLKQRIASTHGHLSNGEAATLLEEVLHADLLHVVLGHLSENSNRPEVALRTVGDQVGTARFHTFTCGSFWETTSLIEVDIERPSLVA